jgi:hypothetical protein
MNTTFDEQENWLIVKETEWMESAWVKLFRNNCIPEATENLALKYKRKIDASKNEIIFTTKSVHIFNGILYSILILAFVLAALNKETGTTVRVFILLFCLLLLAGGLNDLFSQTKNFKIIINSKGLTIRNHFYKWDELKKIYLIKRPSGRGYRLFINLSLDTQLNDKIEITNHNASSFNGIEKKLSAYIEFFRNKIQGFYSK